MTLLKFALHSVTAGLALAFIVLFLKPEWIPAGRAVHDAARQRALDGVSYASAVTAATPAVVNVYTARAAAGAHAPLLDDPFFTRYFADSEQDPGGHDTPTRGSGVIMSAEGFVVTNHHLIRDADNIHVLLQDGRRADATVFGTDPDTDLAVLKIELEDLPTISINTTRQPQVGDVVLAIGNPFGVGQTVTMGIVSATGRSRIGLNTFEDFIQTDAAINPGNSGGALVNPYGELVGINTAIYSDTGGSQGIGFAIPAALASRVMEEIVNHGYVVRGWLGIEVQEFPAAGGDAPGAVTVVDVLADTPASRANLRAGDILTRIDASPVYDAYEALNVIAQIEPGKQVTLGILRDGAPLDVPVRVAQRPASR